ncbi:MAG: nuclear transport factor 2 family protein [Pseudomonadota bacterium]
MSAQTEALCALVERYFRGVDHREIDTILGTLTEDCRFTVETHRVEVIGHTAIRAMFERLWQGHTRVLHDQFVHIPCPERGLIASQFQVTNWLPDGTTAHKSNANVFRVEGERFSAIAVYMSGENTLHAL